MRVRNRGETIRHFILGKADQYPDKVVRMAMDKFGISRQAVHKHVQNLIKQGALVGKGSTRDRSYYLAPLKKWSQAYPLRPGLAEDRVWREDVAPRLGDLPDNVIEIWQYGFTEMLNNAIDHSGGTKVVVALETTAMTAEIMILDDGEGIFRKIQRALGLADERHAVLELAKGKFTTDPDRHTGEGIFFTSRMLDKFDILSGGVFFTHEFSDDEDWIIERPQFTSGTAVWMKLNNYTSRSMNKIFNRFAAPEEFAFTRTVVPVKLAQYGDDRLISRSQAKRLVNRVDRFKTVIFDFDGVDSIGQAFADEVFRVFANRHSEIELHAVKMTRSVRNMVLRAKS